MSLYPVINQGAYPGVGDFDECSIVSVFRALRQAGYRGPLPTIAEFREAAGVPDRPGKPDGLTPAQVMRAAERLLPDVPAELFSGPFAEFVARLADGTSASLAVWSAYLPPALQFGFLKGHSVGADRRSGRLFLSNPLARNGSAPVEITAADLERAAGGYAGRHQAVAILVPPQEDTPVVKSTDPAPAPVLVDYPKGTMTHDLAGKPIRTVDVDVHARYSPFAAGKFRAVVRSDGELALVLAAACTNIVPIGDRKHNVVLTDDGKVLYGGTI